MYTRIYSFAILLIIIFSIPSYSQDKDTVKTKGKEKYNVFEDYKFYQGRPTIDLSYGISKPYLFNSDVNSDASFIRQGLLEMKLGYTYEKKYRYGKNITKYVNRFIYGGFVASNLDIKAEDNSDIKTWRFGIGNSSGYGYKVWDNSSIILYNSSSLAWTRYDNGIPDPPYMGNEISPVYENTKDFNRTFRFGTGMQAGIIIPIQGIVNIQAQFDRTLVFPRHLVWKNIGSAIIEAIVQSAADGFVHGIFKSSSPAVAPIINFIFKNGIAFALYELRREKMNWPFESAPPMLYDSFKAGFSFKF
jgi:hypothetical protein